jgi:hypothetical protein
MTLSKPVYEEYLKIKHFTVFTHPADLEIMSSVNDVIISLPVYPKQKQIAESKHQNMLSH